MRIFTCSLATAALAVVVALGNVAAAEPKPTTITVPDMHCAGCAKKVVAKLAAIEGVAKVEPNIKAKTIKITPKPNAVLSPKTLWETVEEADKNPTKLEGPSGVFTSKPKS